MSANETTANLRNSTCDKSGPQQLPCQKQKWKQLEIKYCCTCFCHVCFHHVWTMHYACPHDAANSRQEKIMAACRLHGASVHLSRPRANQTKVHIRNRFRLRCSGMFGHLTFQLHHQPLKGGVENVTVHFNVSKTPLFKKQQRCHTPPPPLSSRGKNVTFHFKILIDFCRHEGENVTLHFYVCNMVPLHVYIFLF